jgi:hypothetical protein
MTTVLSMSALLRAGAIDNVTGIKGFIVPELNSNWVSFVNCLSSMDGILRFYSRLPAHFEFQLVDLMQLKHALADDSPGLVGICVVAYDLGGNHEGRDEQLAKRPVCRKWFFNLWRGKRDA